MMRIFKEREHSRVYVAPECDIHSIEMENVIAASEITAPGEVPPVEEDDWGDL